MPFAALAALIYVFVGGTSILLLNKVPGEAIRNANALSLLQGKSVWLLLALSAFLIFILLTNQATPGPKAGAGSTRAAPPPPTGGEQAGTSLRLAEARYRALVEQVPAAVYTERFDQHGVQTYVSPQIKQLTGYTPSEWLAEPGLWQSRILPEDRETAVREDERTNRTLEPYRCEYRLVRRDGSLIWVRDQAVLVRDDDGAPLYWQGILVDITGQKRVNEAVVQSEERFSKAFRSSPMPTCLTTWEEGSLIDANPAFWTLTEYAPGELSGRPLVESHGGIEKHREFLRQLEQRKSLKGLQEKLITKSGRVLDVSVSHEIIRLNDRECILSMFQDVTEQKRAQEGLLRKDAILGSIAFAANEFLKSPRWAANIQPILDRLGSAAEASRVYITRVAPDEHDRFVATRMFESCAPGASPQIENPLQKSFEMAGNGWERWAFLLQRGETIHGIVRGFPSAEQAELIREEIRSIICVPITVSGQWWGYIALDDCLSERVWTENEIEALQAAASILSAAIQRELDGEAAEKQLQELIMLQAVALACSTASDIGGLIQSVTGIIRNTLRPDHCTVELGDEMRRFLLPHPSYRGDASEELNRQNGMIAGIGWRVASSGKAVRIGDVRTISDIVEVSPGIRSALCVPILSDGEVVGVINIESGQMNAFGEDDERLINTIAGSVATAMQKIRLFEAEARRARQAEALREATTALTTSLDLDTLLNTTLDLLGDFAPFDSASIEFIDGATSRTLAGRNIQPGWAGWPFSLDPDAWSGQHPRQPVIFADARAAEGFGSVEGSGQFPACMGIPLYAQDRLTGLIVLRNARPGFYTEAHASAAQTFANQAAIAIENARIFEDEKRRSRIIQALADTANDFAATQELGYLLDKLAQRAAELLQASHVAIYLVQNDNETLKVIAAQGTYSDQLLFHTMRLGEGITGSVIAEGRAEIINDTRRDPRTVTVPGTPEQDGELETMMSAPLMLRGKAIGAINAWRLRADGLFNESELNFLMSIAHQTSVSVELARLFEETARRAREAAAVAEVGRDISATLQLDLVLERIAQYAKDLLNVATSAVYLYDPADTLLHAAAVIGVDAEQVKNDPLVLGSGIAGNIALRKNGEIVNYVFSDPRAITIKDTAEDPYEHIMGVPVLNKEELTGLVVVWRSGAGFEFEPPELNFLSSLAQQAAVAIQNARSFAAEQNGRLREASMLDLMRLAASSLDLDEVNHTILGHLMRLIPCESGTIQLLQGQRLKVSAAIGFPPGTIQRGSSLLVEDFPLNGEVIAHKRPIRIADIREDERYRWIPGIDFTLSLLAIPIIFRGSAIGMATLDSPRLGRFTPEDEELAMAVANNAANAIGNARLFELEQQGRQSAENLRIAAAAVTSSLDPHQVLETILTALKQVVPYDSASILLREGEQVRITAAQGLPRQETAINRAFPADNSLFKAIAAAGEQPIILYDAGMDPRFERWAAADDVRGWMGVPLVARGETVGYITLDSRRAGAFDENAAALAQTFAYQAAVAIDNARLYHETRRRLQELEVVSRVSLALRALHNHREMLPVLLEEVLKIMDTDAASIWLYDPAADCLEQQIASGWQAKPGARGTPPVETLSGRVFGSGEVHLIEDFASELPHYSDWVAPTENAWSGVGVPIRTASETIGALVVAVPLPRRVESSQVQLLITLAEIAGNAIHRVQLYDQSEEQVRRLTALRDVDGAITSSFDLRVTLNILLDHMLSELKAGAAAVFSYSPEMRMLSHISSLGFRDPGLIQKGVRISGSLLNQVLLERREIQLADIRAEPFFHRRELAGQEQVVSYYAAPLVSKGQIKGILELYFREPRAPQADWLDFFQAMAGQAAIAIDNSQLFDSLQRTNRELSMAYDTTLEGWGKALELRDKETQGHTERVADLTMRLARRLGIPEAELLHVRRGVLLHDIGKMGVPDQILKKTGPLTEDEWVEMRLHPGYAYDLLQPIAYLRPALDIPYCHHERWDGAGYPRRLSGEDIPLSARIFAVVDVWDALLNDRPYRSAWPREDVIEYIRAESGTHFDPRIASEFLIMVQEDQPRTE